MAKRKYIKRSEYWGKFKKKTERPLDSLLKQGADWMPELLGDSFYSHSSQAAYSRTGNTTNPVAGTNSRINRIGTYPKFNAFANIRDGMLPYDYSTEGVNIQEAVLLCQKAYANIAIFRNAVDIMAEFANSELYLEGGTKKSRDFISKWFQKVSMWKVTDQFFREYYKSGNVFIYRIDGDFTPEDFNKLSLVYGSSLKPGKVPLKYTFLNPFDIVNYRTTAFRAGSYRKILSEYELERLRNPKNEEDEQIFKALPDETQKSILKGGYGARGIAMPLEVENLSYSFYKKQDYEPFAVPFGFPVLADINWKMELKKIDQAIANTIENVILLITMGNTPDKGGINPRNMEAMQALFRNESIGRVLVSDYTTKAEFVIPDLNKVLGPEKYQVVNEDIKEGLQNVIVGQERYASTMVKAEIFLERLKEARHAFLNDFLQPQIKMVCQGLGFRKYPTVKFAEIDLKDEIQFHRITTRLIELGILTPEEGMRAIKTGIYPETTNMVEAQEKFLGDRQKGYYNPMVGGMPVMPDLGDAPSTMREDEEHDEDLDKIKELDPPIPQSMGPPKQPGRPPSSSNPDKIYSRADLGKSVGSVEALHKKGAALLRKHEGKKRLNKNEKALVERLCESVVISCEVGEWEEQVATCIKDFNQIEGLTPLSSILEVSAEHDIDTYSAALLYHSDKISQ